MTSSPSFERIDYMIRSNKSIERKLIFDVLSGACKVISFRNHQYLGFGSIWFIDFRLAHKLLDLERMISIEYEDFAPRAEYNKPYRSIEVKQGDCLTVLQDFHNVDWADPFVAWFDFDRSLNESIPKIVHLFLANCAPNSVLIITVNAQRTNYRRREVAGLA